MRINHLLSSALKPDEKAAEKKIAKAAEKSPDPVAVATTKTYPTKDEKGAHAAQKPIGDAKPEGDVVTAAEKSDNKQGEKDGRSSENADRGKG